MKKINILLLSLLLIGYLINTSAASFYMLKGFTNAQYINVSANSFEIQYPINSVANTIINVSATFISDNALGNAAAYINYEPFIMLSGINGSTFEGNLSFIPYKDGILIPKLTLQGNTYKTLAFYYNTSYTLPIPFYMNVYGAGNGYKSQPFKITTYTDTLQNNYQFAYYSFLNYTSTSINNQTIPSQPNNNTDTGGNMKVSFNQLSVPYYLITSPNTTYVNLTYYKNTPFSERQISALYTNGAANLVANNKISVSISNTIDSGILLAPKSKIWLGYLNMPLYYTNYTLYDNGVAYNTTTGLYYAGNNYVLNIVIPNTQKVYASPSNFYLLVPAFSIANAVVSNTTTITPQPSLPKFEYQFNITNINFTMQPSMWLNWSGGYTIKGFNSTDAFKTSYLMFSLPAYPCLKTTDGNYGAIQVYGYSGSTNLGSISIAQWQVQNNRVYYVMPNQTNKGLAYTQATAYICTPTPILSQLNSSLASKFVIAKYTGSGKAAAASYTTTASQFITFINPTLFYGNETIDFYDSGSSGDYDNIYVYAQKAEATDISTVGSGSVSLNQLANNQIYIAAAVYMPSEYHNTLNFWSNNEAFDINGSSAGVPNPYLYNATTKTFADTGNSGVYFLYFTYSSTTFYLPYNAKATLVNFFTTRYMLGNLTGITTTSSSNSSGVSNPVITPTSPKLNLSITNSTIAANLATLNTKFKTSVALFGVYMPLGVVYIIVLVMVIVLALVSRTEGAVPLILAVLWFAGLIFVEELIIAAIITLVYATYKVEGMFK